MMVDSGTCDLSVVSVVVGVVVSVAGSPPGYRIDRNYLDVKIILAPLLGILCARAALGVFSPFGGCPRAFPGVA
jgi:hypothetical protein